MHYLPKQPTVRFVFAMVNCKENTRAIYIFSIYYCELVVQSRKNNELDVVELVYLFLFGRLSGA